jgi:hypothetical protein
VLKPCNLIWEIAPPGGTVKARQLQWVVGKHSWFKLFGEQHWAECFLNGEVLFRSLSYFRDFEDPATKQVIGDRHEGIQAGMPEGGIITTDHVTGKFIRKFEKPFEFNALVRTEDIFVFCVSQYLTDDLAREFRATACIELFNKTQFFARLRAALPTGADLIFGPVRYYDYTSEAHLKALLTATPEEIVKSKFSHFEYQNEYRFAFSSNGALDAGSGRLCLRPELNPTPNPAEHHKAPLNLGDLSDICRLHLLSKTPQGR